MKQNLSENKKYYLLIFVTMVIQAVRYFPFKFGGWNYIQLSFTWSYGFIQRAFIGTILDAGSTLFHIPLQYMRYIYGIFTVVFYTLIYCYILYATLGKTKDQNEKNFYKGLALAFFIGPGWVAFYSNFGITDVWLALTALFTVCLIAKNKFMWFTIILSIIGELIHPGYVYLYFNLVLAFLVYKAFLTDNKIKIKYIIYFLLHAVVASLLFFYMFLFSHTKEGITVDYVLERTAEFMGKTVEEIANHTSTIEGFLFRQGTSTGIQFIISSWGLLLVAMAIVFAPFFYELFKYWKLIVGNARKNHEKYTWLYVLLPMGVITLVPVYIMQNDYGRWTYAGMFYEFALIWLLNVIRDRNVIGATKEYMHKVKDNKWYYVFLISYAAICGTFHQNLINDMISTIETCMWKLLGVY